MTAFLIILFFSYFSLGLPDSGAGVAWPFLRAEFNEPLAMAGVITIITKSCACLSSLAAGKLMGKVGSGIINAFSCLLSGTAVLACSFAPSFLTVALLAVPLGLGGGAVDASLNGYVARNFSSRVMNWLQACWGLGAMVSPFIVTLAIKNTGNWRTGYLIIGCIQLTLSIVLFCTLKMWKKDYSHSLSASETDISANLPSSPKHAAIWLALLVFFIYSGIEQTMGLWLGSLLAEKRGYGTVLMGTVVSVYFGSIMLGRLTFGFISKKIGNVNSVRAGLCIAAFGIALMLIRTLPTSLAGAVLFGFGLAPVYPCSMHETPRRFKREDSAKLIGVQMAFAYLSVISLPSLIGFICSKTTLEFMPAAVAALIALLFFATEMLNAKARKAAKSNAPA